MRVEPQAKEEEVEGHDVVSRFIPFFSFLVRIFIHILTYRCDMAHHPIAWSWRCFVDIFFPLYRTRLIYV